MMRKTPPRPTPQLERTARRLLHDIADDLAEGGKAEITQIASAGADFVLNRQALRWAIERGLVQEDRRPFVDGNSVTRVYPTSHGWAWIGRAPVPVPEAPKSRCCLGCGSRFMSDGAYHRMCAPCRSGQPPDPLGSMFQRQMAHRAPRQRPAAAGARSS
jgi:hypothetical protein